MKLIPKLQNLLPFALVQLCNRNTGPPADHPGNLILRYRLMNKGQILLLQAVLLLVKLRFQLRKFPILQACRFIQIRSLLGCLNLLADLLDLFAQLTAAADHCLLILPLYLLSLELFL